MFDEVTKKEGGRRAAQRAGFIFGSTVFQALLISGIVAASAYVKAKIIDAPEKVDVKFVKTVAAPKPPPPPAAPPPKRPPRTDKPKTDLPKPPPPQALIQPQEIKAEMKPPDPNEKEPEYDWGDSGDGDGEGVVGGVVGGGGGVEDAPAYATAGYRKPAMSVPKCVQEAARIPRDLQGFISGPITVQFAILRDGSPSQFKVITNGVPDRIATSIWQAVQECKWVAGADPQGKATNIWVILPLRFTSG